MGVTTMFRPSQLHHRSCEIECQTVLPDTFGVLCWNIYKQNKKHFHFKHYLHTLHKEKSIDICIMQEAAFSDQERFALEHCTYDAAANIEVNGGFYGVLTASLVASKRANAYLSEGRESLFGPHKSLLVSCYPLSDGRELLILNVHAINFRESRHYRRELEHFLLKVRDHKGPMIIAGDFNTWNNLRMKKLYLLCEGLELQRVPFSQDDKIKSFMGHHLDFIFFRGLELLEYEVIEEDTISDHNPLFARFGCPVQQV
ncbi:MAG: endonuclease/exonuclease/phosphatase family protein [Sulfurovum sp.]|nr:endonuclease/exonuclease/phosphatase family protein [Sulfurovum sp.]